MSTPKVSSQRFAKRFTNRALLLDLIDHSKPSNPEDDWLLLSPKYLEDAIQSNSDYRLASTEELTRFVKLHHDLFPNLLDEPFWVMNDGSISTTIMSWQEDSTEIIDSPVGNAVLEEIVGLGYRLKCLMIRKSAVVKEVVENDVSQDCLKNDSPTVPLFSFLYAKQVKEALSLNPGYRLPSIEELNELSTSKGLSTIFRSPSCGLVNPDSLSILFKSSPFWVEENGCLNIAVYNSHHKTFINATQPHLMDSLLCCLLINDEADTKDKDSETLFEVSTVGYSSNDLAQKNIQLPSLSVLQQHRTKLLSLPSNAHTIWCLVGDRIAIYIPKLDYFRSVNAGEVHFVLTKFPGMKEDQSLKTKPVKTGKKGCCKKCKVPETTDPHTDKPDNQDLPVDDVHLFVLNRFNLTL